MKLMLSRFAGKCAACGEMIARNQPIGYDRDARKAYHEKCIPALSDAEIERQNVAAYVSAGLGEDNY
jgi:hypothetical protein